MMHAAGVFHEQSRYDSDQYVVVKYENMKDGASSQFDKQPLEFANTQGLPYDYASVMHYGRTDFSKNGLPTIEAKGDPGKKLGQDIGLSDLDIQKIQKFYECDAPSTKVFSKWTDWTCKVYDSDCWKSRERLCTADSLSSCPKANDYGIETEWQYVNCPCA
ncbi:zinc metalloproteinase nas-4 [Exaiptasia diaphana]|uniref:Metalloendopeptidase n=1 Tax=Exaiptasia diaphana TaxID=2652724 RepID=A0A913X2Q8_EXADI|nr:zinc metalloproteinase nas-4 [Exaiptasia diaphana]KXJ15913.1 Zinc metalloproteinase nas-4 [Exaiptasia diaphana]